MTNNKNPSDQKKSDLTSDALQVPKKTLTLNRKLELKKPSGAEQVRQSFSHGRSKTVEVEVKRKRLPLGEQPNNPLSPVIEKADSTPTTAVAQKLSLPPRKSDIVANTTTLKADSVDGNKRRLTHGELETRMKALQNALKYEEDRERESQLDNQLEVDDNSDDILAENSLAELPAETEESQTIGPVAIEKLVAHPKSAFPAITGAAPPQVHKKQTAKNINTNQVLEEFRPIVLRAEGYGPPRPTPTNPTASPSSARPGAADNNQVLRTNDFTDNIRGSGLKRKIVDLDGDEDDAKRKNLSRVEIKRTPIVKKQGENSRKLNRNVLTRVLEGDLEERGRSIASLKRARQKYKSRQEEVDTVKVVREVVIPESIVVSELANRMAVRGGDVIKALMKLGMMVTINQAIDADTAELLCNEFGHKPKRVADSDIEIGLSGEDDSIEEKVARAPVVTIMGHVDHGKTSLLDALRKTDVAGGEAGGITQHIGAYQVTLKNGQKITFIDTPGHEAFSEMRARGANVTDIVILVVAADDGIMPQTIEAINHAKAANVPLVVAINKVDKPDANPERVRNELLQHNVVLEEYGGEVMSVEVSAKQGLNLDKLEEAILLQAEILDLKANPNRLAQGVVIEARVEKGRGSVATLLIQRGTLKNGDILVAGREWGRVRALMSDHGKGLQRALPAMPVEVLGLNGTPSAGEVFLVVDNEAKAREITEYRQHRHRELALSAVSRTSVEQMMLNISSGETKELAVVIKTDVQGSLEALSGSLARLSTSEVAARVLHGAVGAISESDVTLAKASAGIIIGFNVRANPQAKEMAKREGVEIRYYSIIYDALDDLKVMMSGLLAPTIREKFLGNAEIRNVFNITKIGKIAGCFVTEGMFKRGAKVRLLRDNVVIHEGSLKTLKRFKDEVKEVKESYECGMAFENYEDIRVGDLIECFELESIRREL